MQKHFSFISAAKMNACVAGVLLVALVAANEYCIYHTETDFDTCQLFGFTTRPCRIAVCEGNHTL
jgi:hypothetical protein